MKLIELLINLFGLFLDFVYYVVSSPYCIVVLPIRYYKTKKWRKNPSVGDRCYFKNMLGDKTVVIIKDIDPETGRVLIVDSCFSRWSNVGYLFPYTYKK
jgi:hypothetical protein